MSKASSSPAAAFVTFSVDLTSEAAVARRQLHLSHADTTAEINSVTKDSLQPLRLDVLRVCFQLNNAKLGLPYVPTELLEMVNEYCAPLGGFRRLVGVAQYDDTRGVIRFYSETEFRARAKRLLLVDTLLLQFLQLRERAWAMHQEMEAAPSDSASRHVASDAPSSSASGLASRSLSEAKLDAAADSGGGDGTALQSEEEPTHVSEPEEESEPSEKEISEVVAEIREALSGSGLSSNDANYAHRWDYAFADAFFHRFDDDRRADILRWLHHEPDEIHQRLRAADPHCDIQQLTELIDQDGWRSPVQGGPMLSSRCVFTYETSFREKILFELALVIQRSLDAQAAAAEPRGQQ